MQSKKNIPFSKNIYTAFNWAVALSAVTFLSVAAAFVVAFTLMSDAPTPVQASLAESSIKNSSTLVNLPGSSPQQDKKAAKKVAKTDGYELDGNAEVADEDEDVVIVESTGEQILEKALSTLKDKIAASNLETQHPMFGTNDEYFGDRAQLLRAIKNDPLLLDSLLEVFAEDPHSLLGVELAAVISSTGSPKAQALALEISSNGSDYTVDQRGAALLMVADMESITPVMRDGLLANIQQETDTDVTEYLLIALTNAPSTVEEYANVQSVLNETLNRDDANVRRHAINQIGEWATSDADLAPLRTLAIEETDINARARAVMSLGISDYKSAESKAVLYAVVQNDESAILRLKAWEALKGFQLSDAESADYAALGERLELDVNAWISANR